MTTINVLKVAQPIGEFFIGAIDAASLLEITTVDVREFGKGQAGTIDGIQRELSKSRLKELSQYVNLEYATFPTSVILAIDERCVTVTEVEGCIGLYVSIFVGADIADQAEIFSRVNLAQTKVNKSLTYDLLEYANEKSPYKVAHDVVVALNADVQGPFYEKIKRLGVRTPGVDGETLAQATVVNGLLRYLPPNQEKERSKSLFGLSRRSEPRESWRSRIFIDYYREDDFAAILLIVSNYFEAVADKWPDAWNNPQEGQILARTTGFNALIRFLKDAFLHIVESLWWLRKNARKWVFRLFVSQTICPPLPPPISRCSAAERAAPVCPSARLPVARCSIASRTRCATLHRKNPEQGETDDDFKTGIWRIIGLGGTCGLRGRRLRITLGRGRRCAQLRRVAS